MANEIQKSNLQVIQEKLLGAGAIRIFKDALPAEMADHAEAAALRLAKMTYTAVTMSADLQRCSAESITKAASIAASLNLDIDPRGLAYLVPFKNQAVFIIGYQGLMELARRSGLVKQFGGSVIYESEKDKIVVTRTNGRIEVVHPYSWEKPTGEIIAAYVTAEVEGYGTQTLLLRKDEIEFYRSKSAAPNSPAWKNYYGAMAMKTCVRQLCKWLPKTVTEHVERGFQEEERQASFVESQVVAQKQIEQNNGSLTADNVFSEQPTEPQTENFMED